MFTTPFSTVEAAKMPDLMKPHHPSHTNAKRQEENEKERQTKTTVRNQTKHTHTHTHINFSSHNFLKYQSTKSLPISTPLLTNKTRNVFFFRRQDCIVASSDSKRHHGGVVQENYCYSDDDEDFDPLVSSFESSTTTSSDDDATRNVPITRWMLIRIVQHCVPHRRMHDLILKLKVKRIDLRLDDLEGNSKK